VDNRVDVTVNLYHIFLYE